MRFSTSIALAALSTLANGQWHGFHVVGAAAQGNAAGPSSVSSSVASAASSTASADPNIVPAIAVTDNPKDVAFIANIKPDAFLPQIQVHGHVTGKSDDSGSGVVFEVKLAGFPAEGGPFGMRCS
jgi:uncharacterized Rossmann fold enzyme